MTPALPHGVVCVLLLMAGMTIVRPRLDPPRTPPEPDIDLAPCNVARAGGGLVIAATIVLYVIFW